MKTLFTILLLISTCALFAQEPVKTILDSISVEEFKKHTEDLLTIVEQRAYLEESHEIVDYDKPIKATIILEDGTKREVTKIGDARVKYEVKYPLRFTKTLLIQYVKQQEEIKKQKK